MKKYKYGVVLGGGGARGYVHLGVLKALEEKGIIPEVISGVSAGAIIGAFVASGKTIDDIFQIMKKYSFGDFTKLQLPKTGLLSFSKLEAMLQTEIGKLDIKDLEKPFYVATTNVIQGKVEYFNEGDLSHIVTASASIPVLFSPVKINDGYYVDGGVFNNVPIEPLKDLCEKIIVISISPIQPVKQLGGIMDIAGRIFQLAVNAANENKKGLADLYIEPDRLREYGLFDTDKADEMFMLGYEYAKNLDIELETSWIDKIKSKMIRIFKS